jgi:prepilin-type N-terminal cleavage/methylation domain-containing protein
MQAFRRKRRNRGFSLIELLVGMSVLLVMMAFLASMMGSATRLTDKTSRNIDASSEAKQILDRIGQDIAGMVNRTDIDQYFLSSPGNDQMFVYSQTPGYFDNSIGTSQQRSLSLIGYRISSSANPSLAPALERVAQGLTWSGADNFPFLVFPPRTSVTQSLAASSGTIPLQWASTVNDPDTTPSFWHTVGSQVFRLEICYQLRDGTFTFTPPTPSAPPAASTSTSFPPAPVPGSINDTTGLVVAIAVLDNKSRQIVPAARWKTLIAALPDLTQNDLNATPVRLMESSWNAAINQSTFAAAAGIPSEAAAQVRIYQRFYALGAPYAR